MHSEHPSHIQPRFSPLLFGVSIVALVWSAVLLFAGGFTTSIGAGMAFLDWPLSNGSLNPEGWTQNADQMAEHSHRLAGMIIGILSLIIAVSFHRIEKRKSVRWIAYALVLFVIAQGVLGGLRVLLDNLNTGADSNAVARSFAIAHAMGAQGVVLTLASLVVLSCPGWFRTSTRSHRLSSVQLLGYTALGFLIVAILIGAVMRHNGAGLAIQTFPAAAPDGSWLPSSDNFGVWVHFLHRTLGILGGILVLAFSLVAASQKTLPYQARALAVGSAFLTGIQIWLGLLILETMRNPHVTTLHMLNGAALVATLWSSIFWSHRSLIPSEKPAPSSVSSRKPYAA